MNWSSPTTQYKQRSKPRANEGGAEGPTHREAQDPRPRERRGREKAGRQEARKKPRKERKQGEWRGVKRKKEEYQRIRV